MIPVSNTEESVQDSNGVPSERVEAIAHELRIPYDEAERMVERAEDCWV